MFKVKIAETINGQCRGKSFNARLRCGGIHDGINLTSEAAAI